MAVADKTQRRTRGGRSKPLSGYGNFQPSGVGGRWSFGGAQRARSPFGGIAGWTGASTRIPGAGLRSESLGHATLGPIAMQRAFPKPIGGAFPKGIGSALPKAVGSALPKAVGSALPKAIGSALPKAIGSTFPTTLGFSDVTSAASRAQRVVTVPDAALYEAAEALRRAALEPDLVSTGRATAALHRAAHETAERRPRHAAVALAAWDALTCTGDPFGSSDRREVLWSTSQVLLSRFISTETEMELLDRMDRAGLERIPPFEETLVGKFLQEQDE
jgi:hypothetical protein